MQFAEEAMQEEREGGDKLTRRKREAEKATGVRGAWTMKSQEEKEYHRKSPEKLERKREEAVETAALLWVVHWREEVARERNEHISMIFKKDTCKG